jgi:hypothetical protein
MGPMYGLFVTIVVQLGPSSLGEACNPPPFSQVISNQPGEMMLIPVITGGGMLAGM